MPFERFEAEEKPTDDASMGDLFDKVLMEIEDRKLEGKNEEPEICLVMRSNILGLDGYRRNSIIVYLGATAQEVAADLTTRV